MGPDLVYRSRQEDRLIVSVSILTENFRLPVSVAEMKEYEPR